MAHDFRKFPELTNAQLDMYYFESPHKQIVEDFRAEVVKVHDGDTIRVLWDQRNFDFPIRFLDIDAPELNARGGRESQEWLEKMILGEEIDIRIDQWQRVDKWGRLLGKVIHKGIEMNEELIRRGLATTFEQRREGEITGWF